MVDFTLEPRFNLVVTLNSFPGWALCEFKHPAYLLSIQMGFGVYDMPHTAAAYRGSTP